MWQLLGRFFHFALSCALWRGRHEEHGGGGFSAEAQMRRVSAGQLFSLFLDVCLYVCPPYFIGLLAVLAAFGQLFSLFLDWLKLLTQGEGSFPQGRPSGNLSQ